MNHANSGDAPRIGRPLKLLDPVVRETVLASIRAGTGIQAACAAAGITSATYRAWMSRGRQAQQDLDDGEPVPVSEQPFLEFVQDVARAHAQGEGFAAAQLRQLMTTTPGMAVGLAAVFVGVARAVEELARAHTAVRRSWGRPLRERQAVALDGGADPAEIAVLVPAAKTRAVDAAIDCAQRAVRLHGATGVTTGAGPEKLLRDAWTGYSCDFTREMLHLGVAAATAAPGA